MFEELVAIERAIQNPVELENNKETVENQLLSLLTSPPLDPAFGEKIRTLRKPDLIDIEFDERKNEFRIIKAIETTLGKINYRKYKQIYNYSEDLVEMLEIIKSNKHLLPDKYNFIKENIDKITVAGGMLVEVVLTADKNIINDDEVYGPDLWEENRDNLKNLVDRKLLKITNSELNKDAVKSFTSKLVKQISKK